MKVLFDLKTTQHFIGGAAEYTRKVFYSLLNSCSFLRGEIQILGLIDSGIGHYAYNDLTPESLNRLGIEFVDLKYSSFEQIIQEKNIDKVFLGCAQYLTGYDVEKISVPVVCVIHDLDEEEYDVNHLDEYVRLDSLKKFLRYKFHVFCRGKKGIVNNLKIKQMLKKNPQSKLITVSEFSKYSLVYHYGFSSHDVEVLYSPERIINKKNIVENKDLEKLISSGKRYYLMLGANRIMKNPDKTINAFRRFVEQSDSDCYFLTLGYPEKQFEHHIIMDYLSESDLVHAMLCCYALVFPSYFEGFGYPPIEAMSFGKPVICSNVTSIREVVGDAAITFSPYYESDIFMALMTLDDNNYTDYVLRSKKRYEKIHQRQCEDLEKLINRIIE